MQIGRNIIYTFSSGYTRIVYAKQCFHIMFLDTLFDLYTKNLNLNRMTDLRCTISSVMDFAIFMPGICKKCKVYPDTVPKYEDEVTYKTPRPANWQKFHSCANGFHKRPRNVPDNLSCGLMIVLNAKVKFWEIEICFYESETKTNISLCL